MLNINSGQDSVCKLVIPQIKKLSIFEMIIIPSARQTAEVITMASSDNEWFNLFGIWLHTHKVKFEDHYKETNNIISNKITQLIFQY
jgi:hypothetical protein